MAHKDGLRPGDSFAPEEWNYHESTELPPNSSLGEVFKFAHGLTKERNERRFPTPLHRTSHLVDGGGEVLDALRVENKEILRKVGAKVAMRIFNVLQGLGERDTALIDAVIEKYYFYSADTPEGGCCYCGEKPCVCGLDKPKKELVRADMPQEVREKLASWTFTDWQRYFDELYGANNRARGLTLTADRLTSEIIEANTASLRMSTAISPEHVDAQRKALLLELADSFAWLAGLYNVLGTSFENAPKLDDEFIAIYGNGCPNCKKFPCVCGAFGYVADRKQK
ncbi:hypothetical protein K2Y00_01745 [Patescibacteria group bacterium]|nr:hypothetical protein [Patescibacteria group bacterium]